MYLNQSRIQAGPPRTLINTKGDRENNNKIIVMIYKNTIIIHGRFFFLFFLFFYRIRTPLSVNVNALNTRWKKKKETVCRQCLSVYYNNIVSVLLLSGGKPIVGPASDGSGIILQHYYYNKRAYTARTFAVGYNTRFDIYYYNACIQKYPFFIAVKRS